ncbi:MAG: hypothetical protein GC161_18265 [Planctomycetaceae bacterium]|nr:hypothetical protein [Planctomycetaceae bacterium]
MNGHTSVSALPWTRTADGLPEPAWLNSRRSAPLLFVVLDSRQVVHGHFDFMDAQLSWWSSDGRRAWPADAVSHWMPEPEAPEREQTGPGCPIGHRGARGPSGPFTDEQIRSAILRFRRNPSPSQLEAEGAVAVRVLAAVNSSASFVTDIPFEGDREIVFLAFGYLLGREEATS